MQTMLPFLSIVGGILIAAGWSIYGCHKIKPGGWQRWLFFASSSVIVILLVWIPLTGLMGLRVKESDIYLGVAGFTIALHLLIERFLPYYVWCDFLEDVNVRDSLNPYAEE